MTAAAGARLGMEVHLILAGDEPETATGNQLLSSLFGAQLHFTGAAESHWGELEIAREALTNQLADEGLAAVLDSDRRQHCHWCAGVRGRFR